MSHWAESMLQWSWQSLLLILAVAGVVRVFRFRSAADRYVFWLIGVVAVAALPLANGFVKALPPVKIAVLSAPDVAKSTDIPSVPATVSTQRNVTIVGTPTEPEPARPVSWRPFVVPVLFSLWCSGVVIYLFRPCRSWWQSRRLRRTAQPYPIRSPMARDRILQRSSRPCHDRSTSSDDSLARRYSRLGYSRGTARRDPPRTGARGKTGPHRQPLSNAGGSGSFLSPRGAVRAPSARCWNESWLAMSVFSTLERNPLHTQTYF